MNAIDHALPVYPERRLIGVVWSGPDLRSLLGALGALPLKTPDVMVLCGEAGERWLDPDGDRHGRYGRFVRWSQGLTDEHQDLREYGEELRAGRAVVTVHVRRDDPAFTAVLKAYQSVGAQRVRYFGPNVIEDEPT